MFSRRYKIKFILLLRHWAICTIQYTNILKYQQSTQCFHKANSCSLLSIKVYCTSSVPAAAAGAVLTVDKHDQHWIQFADSAAIFAAGTLTQTHNLSSNLCNFSFVLEISLKVRVYVLKYANVNCMYFIRKGHHANQKSAKIKVYCMRLSDNFFQLSKGSLIALWAFANGNQLFLGSLSLRILWFACNANHFLQYRCKNLNLI